MSEKVKGRSDSILGVIWSLSDSMKNVLGVNWIELPWRRSVLSKSSYLSLYSYSVQYLHVLQDSKRYMTHSTAQVQSNSQITDIPFTERQTLKDDHLSTSLRFFNLPRITNGKTFTIHLHAT